ncbi:DNA helicase, putative [Plasmodium ovale]|uniref:DNA helicase, putative n=1 Tax=Plasmodium ovale TaxID=36330 RepID=A0A1C3KUL9_PLAOA|nr:DNA helicase, putative [Plasmodium ovale]
MRSKYFLKKSRKGAARSQRVERKGAKNDGFRYAIPVSTSVYNSTILQKHEKIISKSSKRERKETWYEKGDTLLHKQNGINELKCEEVKRWRSSLRSDRQSDQEGGRHTYSNSPGHSPSHSKHIINLTSEGEREKKGEGERERKGEGERERKGEGERERKGEGERERKGEGEGERKGEGECLHQKFRNIKSLNGKFQDLMKNLKLSNKDILKYMKCDTCNCSPILKKGKYGNFFACSICNKRVSKRHVDNFIFNEKENTFYKDKNKICFEIENKYSYRIHYFGNIIFGNFFNRRISEIIRELISDLRKIKKNKIKYRNIIRYIYKINTPSPPYHDNGRNNGNHHNSVSRNQCNFSFSRTRCASAFRKKNYIPGRTVHGNESSFTCREKSVRFFKTKRNHRVNSFKGNVHTFLENCLKNDYFDEMKYLPLTWKPRKDHINSGIFPFYLSKDVKKVESFRRLSVNNNNYLSGCVFNLCSYQLVLHYFIYNLFDLYFIYEIPNTLYYFFRNVYPTYNNKYVIFMYFLKNKYIDTISKIYGKYEYELRKIRQRCISYEKNQHLGIVDKFSLTCKMEERDKICEEYKRIFSLYKLDELSSCTYILKRKKLSMEILQHFYAKEERKIKKKIFKEIKNICLNRIKQKLPSRIRKVILPYQLETIYFFKKKKGRILIADEMGLGKTLQCISIFHFYNLYPVLIVVPASLKINWFTEIERFLCFLDTSQILVIDSSNDFPKLSARYRIVIVSFAIYKKLYNLLGEIKFKLIVVDESHYIRTVHYGKQSQLAKMLKKKIQSTKKVIFLSGTPSINRPINIFHQIKYLINNKKIFCKNKLVFGEEFCKKYFYRGEKIYEENLRSWEFNLFLKKTVMIRRTIADVFKNNFSNLKRFFVHLPNGGANLLSEDAQLAADENGNRTVTQQTQQMQQTQQTQQMQKTQQTNSHVSTLFHVCAKSKKEEEGLLKVVNALKYIETNFAEKKKIIFCYHLVVCKYIEEELLKIIKKKKENEKKNMDYVMLSGCMSEKEKLEKIKYFQTVSNCYYGIFTICSTSHGLDFSFCNLCFFVEFPVNFFHLQQCESRLFRKNQRLDTYVFYFILKNGLGSDLKTWKRFMLCSHSTRSIIDGTCASSQDLFYDKLSEDILPQINYNILKDKNGEQFSAVKKRSNDTYYDVFYDDTHFDEKRPYKEDIPHLPQDTDPEEENKEQVSTRKYAKRWQREWSKDSGKETDYRFEVNPLTNIIHAYTKNKKTNFPIDDIKNTKGEKTKGEGGRTTLRRCANIFIQNYNKLNIKDKKLIEKKKCDINISLLKYLRNSEDKNRPLKFQRYIKNTTAKDKTYVKAYIEDSFKGKFQVFYYQEYEEATNTLKCLYCKNNLQFAKNIIHDEKDIIHYLDKHVDTQTVDKFKKELDFVKLNKNNIKKILLCEENNLFCEGNCRKLYFLKKSSCSLRRLIFERDKGICNICKMDCTKLLKEIKSKKYFSIHEKMDYFIKVYPLFIENVDHLKNILQKPKEGYIWHVDHILPVYKGGGEASFDNLQTLCTFCHKKKTKDDVKDKRRQNRRTPSAQGA